ncbi:MAG: extracellular solute-binding protein [Treponema sp.]|jgi:putative aldouronate transport system substrate-binding protein|nr:extracellular solute-binding protein [Treponema sp.]
MKKKIKKLFFAFGIVMVLSVAVMAGACQKSGGSGGTTLKMYLFGDAQNMDKALDKFYAQTKDTLNVKLDIIWSSGADHRQKMPLIMSNQEDADLVFDAYWMNLNRLITQGAYADISSYFNNDQYPGLKKAFPPGFIAQVTNADGSIYAVPFTQAAEDIQVILLRKDLREKYGMAPIASNAELETYFKNVQADIARGALLMAAPFGVNAGRGFYYLDDDIIEKRASKVINIDGTGDGVGMQFDVAISADGTKVLGAATLGDPDSAYAMFPAPYNRNTRNDRVINALTKWGQYAQNDRQTETDAKKNLFFVEKVAAFEGNISNYREAAQVMEGLGKSLEMYVYVPTMQARRQVVTTPLTAWNFLCVPQQSKKIGKTMAFLDWLFQSRANHDLFELGIEGEDWTAVGDSEYTNLAPSNKYTFPGYEMTWNPNYIRTDANYPAEVKEIFKYQNNPDTYIASPVPGFTFNNEVTPALRTAFAAVAGIQATYRPILMLGLSGSPEKARAALDEYYTQVKNAGLDVIRQAVIDQVQQYLDTH